jgi:prevent-host-death family protein
MARSISQRELRNENAEIMRAVDRGESFVVTRNGVPVADIVPHRRTTFVSTESVLAAFAGDPGIDFARFRADVDADLDLDPEPRA